MGRLVLSLLLLCGASLNLAGQQPQLDNAQIQALIRQAAEADLKNDRLQRDYTYTERTEVRHLDGQGRVKSTDSKTYEVMELYGEPVRRLVAKNGQPLSGNAARKEDARIQKLMDKRSKETGSQREKRQAKEEKEREDDRQFVREVADAYNFRLVGIERPGGRETYVIDAEPRPGYHAQRREARMLPKFRFRVWIDKQDSEWQKLDIECIDTVSFGLVLARLHKGSRIVIEQTRVNNEVWLPRHVALKVSVRLGLVKGHNLEADFDFSNYKKFRVDTKIVVMEPK